MLHSVPEPIRQQLARELGVPADYASEGHAAFFESRHPELVASGWMGAGKSRILCQKAWWVARKYPGVTVALFRKAQNSIAATTERTFERDVLDRTYLAKRNKSEHWYELTNGSRIYFLGLDPDPITGVPSKVGSLDLAWAGVDEAVELTQGDWIMILGRLRDPRIDWWQVAAATNPGPPKHWLKVRMSEDTDRRLLLHIKSNRFLPEQYVQMLSELPDNAIGRRLGTGEWVGAEGAIWTLPEEQVQYPIQEYKRVIAGLDWGFVHAFACEVVGQTGSGQMAVIDEVYERGTTIDQIIPKLKHLAAHRGVSTFYADPSEPAYIAQCVQAGLNVVSANNSVHAGLTSVMKAIKAGMTVSPACTGLLEEIPGYTWQSNRLGLQEKPIEVNDDACDALRYAVMALDPTSGAWGAGNAWGVS
jgi:PBSX family phage terminase large subunit